MLPQFLGVGIFDSVVPETRQGGSADRTASRAAPRHNVVGERMERGDDILERLFGPARTLSPHVKNLESVRR